MASNLCQPLPERYMKGLDVVGSEKGHKKEQPSELKDFFANKLPPGDRKEVAGEFKKTLVLAAQRPKKGKGLQVRKSKKELTAKERRNLGLFRLPKRGLQYSSFLPLHNLWSGYMKELLDLGGLEASGWKPGLNEEPRQMQLQTRLCRADLHGAMVKVATATCPSHKDVQGLVVMETKNTLQILGKDNTLRLIPKLGSSFTFVVGGYLFTIPGASIDSKPADRATKKLKNKVPLDF